MSNRQYLHPGEIIFISQGEYSSYSVSGVFLVAKRFHWQTAQTDCVQELRKEGGYVSRYALAGWLERKGYIVEVEAEEWHIDW